MTRYCRVCQAKRWFTPEGNCVVCIGLFRDAVSKARIEQSASKEKQP